MAKRRLEGKPAGDSSGRCIQDDLVDGEEVAGEPWRRNMLVGSQYRHCYTVEMQAAMLAADLKGGTVLFGCCILEAVRILLRPCHPLS